MEVIGFGFSPRKNGNSDILLDSFLQGVEADGGVVRKFFSRGLKIHGCLECGGCDQTGICVVRDDMDELYPLLVETKRIVIASPIFFYGVPSEGKALMDRAQALWNRTKLHPELKRPDGKGFFLGVGATKGQNLFEGAILGMKYYFEALGLPKKLESLTYHRVENKGAIRLHPAALVEAFEAGRRFGQS